MQRKIVVMLALVGLTKALGCSDEGKDEPRSAPASALLRAHAFPSTVEPGGQATIAVEVMLSDCQAAASACTVCVGLPPTEGGARLYPPPGINVPGGTAIGLPITSSALLQSITYLAPKQELSEVVSVACFRGSIDCAAGAAPADLLATTTERILIRKATATAPAPASASDAGGEGAEEDDEPPDEMPSSDAG